MILQFTRNLQIATLSYLFDKIMEIRKEFRTLYVELTSDLLELPKKLLKV